MRCRLILLIIFCALLNKVYGQSPSAAIDSLIKYHIITTKQRPVLEKAAKTKGGASYRVAILRELENIMLQKTFHIDPHKTGIMYSYGDGYLNKKSQDSVNTILRQLVAKMNKTGLLTDRVYNYTLKEIDSSHYVADMQMIGGLAEMSLRLEWLAPDKLLPVIEQLHQNGIVSDSSFFQLKKDIGDGKIESTSQLTNYCRLSKAFNLKKYGDDPNIWLEKIHRDMASIMPGLNFTDFNYTTTPDTSLSLSGVPGIRFIVSLVCNGHTYKHTCSTYNFKHKQGKIGSDYSLAMGFYRIFNKILTDQQSPFRLHIIMLTRPGAADDINRYFSLIALREEQAEVFMKPPCFSYMMVSMDSYDNNLTSVRIDSTITEWKKIGLFAHLSNTEINKAIDDAEADDLFSINKLLTNFPRVIYSLNPAWIGSHYPYRDILSHLAQITHGAFKPDKITQQKVSSGVKLQYLSKGKIHSYIFHTNNGWLDAGFSAFLQHLGKENDLPGNFYSLLYENAVIYLTKQQHDYAITHKLLDLAPDKK